MSNGKHETRLIAIWSRDSHATAWQAFQAHLSKQPTPALSTWMRRSAVTCRWRALPAGVSAPGWSR
jgi:hypothetical protein